jgi:hypothetical protein
MKGKAIIGRWNSQEYYMTFISPIWNFFNFTKSIYMKKLFRGPVSILKNRGGA